MSSVADRLHLFWLGAKARARERRRWKGVTARPGPPAVFYGRDRLPGRDEVAGGGIVKCQDLLPEFPNTPERPNTVYLVSSALPVEAAYLGKLARRAGARLVLNQNGVAYPAWHGAGWERTNEPMAQVLADADHVFYQSAFCKMAADRFLGSPRGHWDILYNPVDTSLFRPATETPAGGEPVLLCTGSHHSFYRVQVALEVLAIVRRALPGARLTLAGGYRWRASESEALAETRASAAALGVEQAVEIRGAYTQEEAPALYGRAQILLHTKYADPCPRVVVEAMACGLPVVYSATGGVPELVAAEAGIGVPGPLDWERDHPPSAAAMADAVLIVAGALGRYSAAARGRAVSRFDVAPWVGRHREVFVRLTARSTGGPAPHRP
jgi:glycosyltransferase involved in cell wall biosynthesis